MLTHAQVWSAIDRLAARAGLSASGLARRAGLDPTTFNKSKRITPQGRARWPSTESIAKALAATGTPFDTFVTLIEPTGGAAARAVPLLGFAEAGAGGYFDDGGFPAGEGWDEIAFPAVTDEHAYALEVSGQSMEPAYRDGDVILVSPLAPIRRGDRVVVRTKDGEVLAKELKRKTAKSIELYVREDRLRHRLKAAAARALQDSKENDGSKAWRDAAEQGADGENDQTHHEKPLAAESAGKPSANGQDDGIRHQIGGEHPGALIVAGAKAARHVGQCDVGDARVEHIHERGHRHDNRDQPRIELGTPNGGRR